MLKMNAPAKLNLVLEVLGRRADGYHDIRSIMQTISLFDEISFKPSARLELRCSVPELQTPDNLVLKAAGALKSVTGYKGDVVIKLEKHIPRGAGLGGGSSDAAATLQGLNRLWELKLSYTDLLRIGASIGSDVPFFIKGGTCLVEGRGEIIYALPDISMAWFVLLKPEIPLTCGKTGKLYNMLQVGHYTTGLYTEKARHYLEKEGRMKPGLLHNVFDGVAEQAFPGIEAYRKLMVQAGAEKVSLAGSGPVLFAQFTDENKAMTVAGKLTGQSIKAYVASTLTRDEFAG